MDFRLVNDHWFPHGSEALPIPKFPQGRLAQVFCQGHDDFVTCLAVTGQNKRFF